MIESIIFLAIIYFIFLHIPATIIYNWKQKKLMQPKIDAYRNRVKPYLFEVFDKYGIEKTDKNIKLYFERNDKIIDEALDLEFERTKPRWTIGSRKTCTHCY